MKCVLGAALHVGEPHAANLLQIADKNRRFRRMFELNETCGRNSDRGIESRAENSKRRDVERRAIVEVSQRNNLLLRMGSLQGTLLGQCLELNKLSGRLGISTTSRNPR